MKRFLTLAAWFFSAGPAVSIAAPVRYVPAPQPVDTGRYLVGAVMCPLWGDGRRWSEIVPYPDRKPLLGWYDEGDPAVTDWEIKWALDHGISFFLACWYRAKGNFTEDQVRPGSAQWIHEGLAGSRYARQFRFAIMWENANKSFSDPSTKPDFVGKLVPYWIHQYFSSPSYLLVDGKPVYAIFNPAKFVREMGGEAAAIDALHQMRAACVAAGYKGAYLLGQYCWGNPEELIADAALIQRLGMDAGWSYHLPTFTAEIGTNLHPTAEEAISAQTRVWHQQPQPYIPTISMGWDSAPWGSTYSKAQWRLDPAHFETLCRKAKAEVDSGPGAALANRMVLIDNWNEFGEGHYIAPTSQYRFGYLDAVRRVFALAAPPHTDLTPDDVGLGPYDRRYQAALARTPPLKP